MQTAFVAGATGYTGREVVRQLCAGGVRTIAHVRPDSKSPGRWREQFTAMGAIVDMTAWDLPSMRDTMRGHKPDVAFGLLGTTRARAKAAIETGAADASYEAVDYGMTHMVIEALRLEVRTAKMVYLSSVGAKTHTGNAYLRVRGCIEAELMTSGLTYVIARPLFISGPDREETRSMERIGAVATDTILNVIGSIGGRGVRDRFRSITAERLACALIDAASDPAASNTVQSAGELQRRADRK